MGCGASVPAWEAVATAGWPTYTLRRTVMKRSDFFQVEVFAPNGERVMMVTVQLWLTPRGDYVSAKALHPADVQFELGDAPTAPSHPLPEVPVGHTALGYSPKLRTLVGLRSYVRSVGKSRDVGSYDTTWRAAIPPPEAAAAVTGASLLPDEISVVNVDERVCVYRGKQPANAANWTTDAESGAYVPVVPEEPPGKPALLEQLSVLTDFVAHIEKEVK